MLPTVVDGLLRSRARGLLQLFRRKGLLSHTLKFLAALGDVDAVSTALNENGDDSVAVTEAFTIACRFKHEAIASLLLDRAIALGPELGAHVTGAWDGWTSRSTSSTTGGADINTTWSSHEPASILHELVWHRNYEAMQFLIDRGIDMTITDHRWNRTAQGWAEYAAGDPALARWLAEAERQRNDRHGLTG